MSSVSFQSLANFIWSVADLLRGPYRPPQYERVMLPLTVLRRFDCVLEASKPQVLKKHAQLEASGKIKNVDATLNAVARDKNGESLGFHNHSPLDFKILKGDPDNVGRHLQDYINGFSENIRKIFDRFEFDKEIEKLKDSNRLYAIVSKFAEIDLHPDRVDSQSQLQKISDFPINKISSKVQFNENSTAKTKLLNGIEIEIPLWYLRCQGHKLEELFLMVFPELNGIKKGKEELLKIAIIEKVIDDIPELISVDLFDIYSKLQII